MNNYAKTARMVAALIAGVSLVGLGQTAANASVNGSCGPVDRIPAPTNVNAGSLEETGRVRVFQESVGKTLGADLFVDANAIGLYGDNSHMPVSRPAIASGTKVDSYLVHSDAVGAGSEEIERVEVTFSFPAPILGIMERDTTLAESDPVLGATGTAYPALGTDQNGNVRDDRGLELLDTTNAEFFEIVDQYTVKARIRTTSVVDQLRVVTQAVEPAKDGGYRMVATDGGVFNFDASRSFGSAGNENLKAPIAGGVTTCSGNGYWLVGADGAIFTYGDAKGYGNMKGTTLNQPIVGMDATPTNKGYWMVATDGGIFTFGDAGYFGSTGDIKLNKPIVGMATTPSGQGYWLVASDGGIFAFGDAKFHGSTGDMKLNKPIVGMTSTPTGNGYWLVATDGGIFAFGDAKFHGSTGDIALNKPVVGMTTTHAGEGYRLVASDGGIFAFGDAKFHGSTGDIVLNQPIVAMMR